MVNIGHVRLDSKKSLGLMVKKYLSSMVGLAGVVKASISKLCIWKTKGSKVTPCPYCSM